MSYPRLYEATEATKTNKFQTLGIGILSDAVSCAVTEERNGEFELEMEYPIGGIHFSEIEVDKLIVAKANEKGSEQIFRIYKIEKPIDGIVTIYAEHISYLLSRAVVTPFSTSQAASALASIPNYVQWDTDNPNFPEFPFDFWTDFAFSDSGGDSPDGTPDSEEDPSFVMEAPATVRSILGGTDGSILDVFGGEYEFDNFTVKLHSERGSDRNVYLRYGKNITDLKSTDDISNVYTGILPYWKGSLTKKVWDSESQSYATESYDVVVYLDGDKVMWSEYVESYAYPQVSVVDFSSEIDSDYADVKSGDEVTHYTDASDIRKALKEGAEKYVKNNKGWEPSNNIEVSFVQLWDTDEYAEFEALEKVGLCDTVHVVYKTLNIDVSMKVITTEYNVLLDRYNKIELGEAKSSMTSSVISNSTSTDTKIDELSKSNKSFLQDAKNEATNLINGKLDAFKGLSGGHFIFETNEKGQVEEIYCLSGDTKETSQYVLRINLKGIAFSTNGWNGDYDTAWTIDSKFYADFITAGTLRSILIKACTLQSADGTMTIDMGHNAFIMANGGRFEIRDENNTKVLVMGGGSSGYGLYADTLEVKSLYVHADGGYDTWINGVTQGSEISTVGITMRTSKGALAGNCYGSADGAITYYHSADGHVVNVTTSGSFISGSDERLKTGIKDLSDNVAKTFVMQLSPKEFKYKNNNEQSYGFIAQDVLKILPESGGIVTSISMPKADDPKETTEYYGLKYTDIIPFLVSVVQQQEERITKLEEALNEKI